MVAAVCEQALAELDPANPELESLVTQLERTRDEALAAVRSVADSSDSRAA